MLIFLFFCGNVLHWALLPLAFPFKYNKLLYDRILHVSWAYLTRIRVNHRHDCDAGARSQSRPGPEHVTRS